MNKKILNVCVTGAAGHIAYSFFPQLLRGTAFPNVSINLRLLDMPAHEEVMRGIIL
jgi:malate dehydrogenase